MKVTVIGGGIIGLSCAWRLAGEGHAVTLLDAADAAREASWAAAGMLAPHNEADGDGPLWRFGCRSLSMWPRFVADLAASASACDFHQRGCLIPERDASDTTELAEREAWLGQLGVHTERLTGRDLTRAEPALGADVRGALRVPGAQVDPRRVTRLLRERSVECGVAVRYRSQVVGLDGAAVVLADGEHVSGDLVVLASGAWTPALATLTGLELSGEPVKGQMLRFAVGDGLLSHFLHCRHAYCVGRRGFGVVVGSTMVTNGFDRSDSDEAIAELAAGARSLLPALQQAEIAETWTGLRPRLAGGLPCIDRPRDELVIATGHFRNGILLAPATADLVADLVGERSPTIDFHAALTL